MEQKLKMSDRAIKLAKVMNAFGIISSNPENISKNSEQGQIIEKFSKLFMERKYINIGIDALS